MGTSRRDVDEMMVGTDFSCGSLALYIVSETFLYKNCMFFISSSQECF